MREGRRPIFGRIAMLAFAALIAAALPASAAGFQPIGIETSRIGNFLLGRDQTRFGEFEFRGGLVVNSEDPQFGGLSGIDFDADGRHFTAISDLGYWFRGAAERQAGHLVGLGETQWAPMLNDKGKPLGAKRNADAEGLRFGRLDGKPAAFVSFEQTNDLRAYRLGPELALARPERVKLPKSVRGMKRNRGLEAIAIAPAKSALAGSPILIAERALDKAGNHRGWVVKGPLAGEFTLVRSGDYDVTDADFLPNGDLLVLERRVILSIGAGMRLRRIDGAQIRAGAVLDGPVVLEADMVNQIDNMEGLAVSEDEDGSARITLVSDDNLSALQRTLMLEFVWLGPSGSVLN